MNRALMAAVLVLVAGGVVAAEQRAGNPFDGAPAPKAQSPIDKAVFGQLEKLGIEPAYLCSDAVFVRRVYLDVIGTLPTAPEAKAFLLDKNPDKRRILIDKLLERDEFADYWAMKWADLLRVKAEFPINLWPNAVQAYHRWIHSSIKANKPYDQFVREMLTASGSNFREAPVNFYRAMQGREPATIAQAVALTFMGERIETWPKEKQAGLAAFFTRLGYKATLEWKEEIVFFDRTKPAGEAAKAVFPDGTPAKINPRQDPREVLADWLISPKNPAFNRNIANRVWSWLAGRGIIHEPDDARPDNPPANPELLAYLEQELVAAKYDLKHLYRLILNSNAYQLSSVPRSKHPQAAANFASYALRRLEAEVLIDALCQITGTTEKYSSPIPEPFTFLPEYHRSIAVADGSITSAFLEMFGRPPRDTGTETERSNRPSPAQRLHILNSSHIQKKIEQGRKLQALVQSGDNVRDTATGIYLAILSRFPTEEELSTIEAYSKTDLVKGREALIDLAWALMNSAEFLYRH